MQISNTSILKRNEGDFIASAIGEEIVVMDMKSGDFMGLNPVGSHVWNLLEQPATVASIIANLLQEYDVDEATCKAHTLEYIDKMLQKNLLCLA